MKKITALLLAFLLLFTTSCGLISIDTNNWVSPAPPVEDNIDAPGNSESSTSVTQSRVTYGNYYYDLEHVVLYLDIFGELPPNYITKSDARELGWEGGSPEQFLEGAAIGGDIFGNREGLLPQASGRAYTECDIDTQGSDSRGAKRLVFSNDGLYFYTDNHYESFFEVHINKNEVVW